MVEISNINYALISGLAAVLSFQGMYDFHTNFLLVPPLLLNVAFAIPKSCAGCFGASIPYFIPHHSNVLEQIFNLFGAQVAQKAAW